MATLGDVRRIALALPGAFERTMSGAPGFRVGSKAFARRHQNPAWLVLWCADAEGKEVRLLTEPDLFHATPHDDNVPLVLPRLPAADEATLRDRLVAAWRVRAPRRLLEANEAGPGDVAPSD